MINCDLNIFFLDSDKMEIKTQKRQKPGPIKFQIKKLHCTGQWSLDIEFRAGNLKGIIKKQINYPISILPI